MARSYFEPRFRLVAGLMHAVPPNLAVATSKVLTPNCSRCRLSRGSFADTERRYLFFVWTWSCTGIHSIAVSALVTVA